MASCRFPPILAVMAMLAGALATGGCSHSAPAGNRAKTRAVSVGIYAVKSQAYTLTTTLAGRTSAHMTSDVRPQVDGIIDKRLFSEGSEVKAGQVLYQIDAAKYKAAYDSARAQLAQAQAQLQSARPLAERYRALTRLDAVSKQDLDNALATLAADRATIETDQANLETARINLGYTRIRAPIAGRIGASTVTPGALVTADQSQALATITQLDPIYVDINQTSTQFLALRHALRTGQLKQVGANEARVKVSAAGDPGLSMQGRLEFAGVTVDPGTGTVTLRAIVPNPDENLLPGMYVNARLPQGVDEHAILVPQQAVTHDENGAASCLLVNAQNKVVRQGLTVAGAAEGNFWRVSQGLKPGDRVIVQGTDKVKPGDTVKPTTVRLGPNGIPATIAAPAPGQTKASPTAGSSR